MMEEHNTPSFAGLIDLASEKLGGKALLCSDDFFAPMQNLLKPGRGVFIPDKYTDQGKWMDGWESRRKRVPGYDWCIIRLGAPGVIKGIDVDTNHFLGNHPPQCSMEACYQTGDTFTDTRWTEIIPRSDLKPGSQHFFEIRSDQVWSHVRLNIYPDGGVARLNVFGEVRKNWDEIKADQVVDLATAVNGGKAIVCNDMFFSHMDNLIMPGRSENMGDGWETKRNRTPGNRDWVILRLGHKGSIQKIVVDTNHYKGNYPDRCMIEGCVSSSDTGIETGQWNVILPESKLEAHKEHFFENEIVNHGPFTHIRLTIFPDGGISRLRLWGHKSKGS
jgi:allantoicase